jgi:4-hydroxy-3-methylbut-2-enyl diphosphate reductase
LREVAQKKGVRAYLVDHAQVIELDWLQGVKNIAMTAGASTPEKVVQECVLQLQKFGVNAVEEVVYTEENIAFQLPKEILGNSQLRRF